MFIRGGPNKETCLSGTRLGQIGNDVDFLGGSEGANDLAHLKDELFHQTGFVTGVIFEFTVIEIIQQLPENFESDEKAYGLRVTNA